MIPPVTGIAFKLVSVALQSWKSTPASAVATATSTVTVTSSIA